MTDAESDETQASARSDKAAEDAAAETSAVVGADDETTVVPDVTQRAHALAWSTAENPELGTDNRHPLPRATEAATRRGRRGRPCPRWVRRRSAQLTTTTADTDRADGKAVDRIARKAGAPHRRRQHQNRHLSTTTNTSRWPFHHLRSTSRITPVSGLPATRTKPIESRSASAAATPGTMTACDRCRAVSRLRELNRRSTHLDTGGPVAPATIPPKRGPRRATG